jgi:hypothetical protein
MSNSDHEQQVLESIEGDLASTGPKLASMLAIFARLTAGEEMPVREKLWRAFDASSAKGPRASAQAAARTAWPRRSMAVLREQFALLTFLAALTVLAAAIGLIVLALFLNRSAAQGVCAVTGTAACRQLSGPGGPVHGAR